MLLVGYHGSWASSPQHLPSRPSTPAKKASLSIYKYDITKAGNDGAWDAESYVSTGLHDDAVIDKLSKYAIQGVEFTYLRVADIAMNNELVDEPASGGCAVWLRWL